MIGCSSKDQPVVACSSSEAEYIGISEVVKEILFIRQILIFKVPIDYPIYVNVDNVGAIHMAEGSDGKRTKHIDVQFHFVRQYVEDGIVKIIFVTSEENKADPFTKNVGIREFELHHDGYLIELPKVD